MHDELCHRVNVRRNIANPAKPLKDVWYRCCTFVVAKSDNFVCRLNALERSWAVCFPLMRSIVKITCNILWGMGIKKKYWWASQNRRCGRDTNLDNGWGAIAEFFWFPWPFGGATENSSPDPSELQSWPLKTPVLNRENSSPDTSASPDTSELQSRPLQNSSPDPSELQSPVLTPHNSSPDPFQNSSPDPSKLQSWPLKTPVLTSQNSSPDPSELQSWPLRTPALQSS